MVLLSDILDTDLLRKHINNGLVTWRSHESLPLHILNYTPECQFSRAWDDVTRKCRGLIYNFETMEVVARPFEKFGNWDEGGYPYPPSGPALRMEKMDGSLGILYRHFEPFKVQANGDDHETGTLTDAIATRGSFHSEQAEWATKFYNSTQSGIFRPLMSKTYLFEIIYPENRIVVDYGDYKGLVLLDVVDNETGFSDTDEFDNCNWPDKVVRQPIPGFDSGQVVDIPQGGEGFVFLWPTRNFRTKMKSAEYVELHKLISNMSEKTIWEAMVAGKTRDEIKIGLPEEFHKWIDETIDTIHSNALEIVDKVAMQFEIVVNKVGRERKDFAIEIKDNPLRKYLFQMLDGNSVYVVALRDSKPVRNKESE